MDTSDAAYVLDTENGKELRSKTTTADDKYSIAISEDKTIKLYDNQQSKEIYEIVDFQDEWVCKTPQGYYNCLEVCKVF